MDTWSMFDKEALWESHEQGGLDVNQLWSRPIQHVYTRSTDGFSLHRSGVRSVGGCNLKWTKSLENHAKQASKELTKAIVEAERGKRQKQKVVVEAACYQKDAASKILQRVLHSQGEARDTDKSLSTGWNKTSPLLTPRTPIIGGNVYLRAGNGIQLVRDSRISCHALGSEMVQSSLHNKRSPRAKKPYCIFFTKFGKCNKGDGNCPYTHDPEKVAICTKFLKGNCTDAQCLLTHRIIPERLPDCSFFLHGLCTNENCPYRHVNVNRKAACCDGFLRGYCKDGDNCMKKHTCLCSVYAETGVCPNRSMCKFYHPKKKVTEHALAHGHRTGAKRKWRYHSTVEHQPTTTKLDTTDPIEIPTTLDDDETLNGGSMEFISLNIESPIQHGPESRATFAMKEVGSVEEIQKWIKPTFLLHMTSSPPPP